MYVLIVVKDFFEKIPFLPKYQRTTNRLWAFILSRFTEVSSLKSIAKLTSLSQATIGRILDKIDYGLPSLPKVIAFDELKEMLTERNSNLSSLILKQRRF